MKRGEWLFPAVFLGLLFVGYGLVPLPRGREGADSFAVDRGGKKAFFDLASRLLPSVERNTGSLVPQDPEADTLLLLGPARYPDRAQWQTLHDWISEGRALVFAAKWQDPAVDLGPFGIQIVPTLESEPGDETEGAPEEPATSPPPPSEEPEKPPEEPDEDAVSTVETELVWGEIDWRSFGQVRYESSEATVEVSIGGIPQVIWQPVGRGVIIVAASDFVFSNLSMTKENNGLLAFRILESASPTGPVYFDEELNEAGAPRVVGLLLEAPFRLPTLQLVLVTLLFGWMTGRRFGPIQTTSHPERRSLVEHAQALGTLHYRVGTGSSLVRSYLEHFASDLGLRYRASAKGRALEESAGRGRVSSDTVARALRAAKSPDLERTRVGAVIQSLARLRAERKTGASGSGESSKPGTEPKSDRGTRREKE